MKNAVLIGNLNMQLGAGRGNEEQNPINQILAQEGCVSTGTVNAIVDDPTLGTVEATLTIGLNRSNEMLDASDNVVAMPCPDWCW